MSSFRCFSHGIRIIKTRTNLIRIWKHQGREKVAHPSLLCAFSVGHHHSVRYFSRAADGDSNEGEKQSSGLFSSAKNENPMELLHKIFQSNKQAVVQHRELLICLAEGDIDGAGATAAALARSVKQSLTSASKSPPPQQEESPLADTPFRKPDAEILGVTTDKIAETLIKWKSNAMNGGSVDMMQRSSTATTASTTSSSTSKSHGDSMQASVAPWNTVASLRAVVLETLFETVDTGDSVGSSCAQGRLPKESHSPLIYKEDRAQAEKVLNQYLSEEGEKWKMQKHLIVSILLDLAKSMGLTPLDLHACEETGTSAFSSATKKETSLNPLKHTNLVVRGEMPDWIDIGVNGKEALVERECQKELNALKEQILLSGGIPMKPAEEEMALYELRRTKTVLRYSVGIHRDLQHAFNKSENVKQFIQRTHRKTADPLPSGAQYFVSQAIQLLNSDSHKKFIHRTNTKQMGSSISIETPVIPFTFMLKCCLWFEL